LSVIPHMHKIVRRIHVAPKRRIVPVQDRLPRVVQTGLCFSRFWLAWVSAEHGCYGYLIGDMTVAHNAPADQVRPKHLAFTNDMAHVGCPDRRIERLGITAVRRPPSTVPGRASRPGDDFVHPRYRRAGAFLYRSALRSHGPDHSGVLVAEAIAATLG